MKSHDGDLPARLRDRAAALRAIDVHPRPTDLDGILLAEIPSGPCHVLRVIWQPNRLGRGPHLSIRVWRESHPGEVTPVAGVGLEVAYYRLARLAEALADALELARQSVVDYRADQEPSR
jgi:hypothetical protein